MSPAFSARRTADRQRWLAQIAARPSPARFRTRTLNVRLLSEPGKLLTARAGGYAPNYSAEIIIVLPTNDSTPVKSSEIIDVQDLSGVTQSYDLGSVTALEGTGCFRVSLVARRGKAKPLNAVSS